MQETEREKLEVDENSEIVPVTEEDLKKARANVLVVVQNILRDQERITKDRAFKKSMKEKLALAVIELMETAHGFLYDSPYESHTEGIIQPLDVQTPHGVVHIWSTIHGNIIHGLPSREYFKKMDDTIRDLSSRNTILYEQDLDIPLPALESGQSLFDHEISPWSAIQALHKGLLRGGIASAFRILYQLIPIMGFTEDVWKMFERGVINFLIDKRQNEVVEDLFFYLTLDAPPATKANVIGEIFGHTHEIMNAYVITGSCTDHSHRRSLYMAAYALEFLKQTKNPEVHLVVGYGHTPGIMDTLQNPSLIPPELHEHSVAQMKLASAPAHITLSTRAKIAYALGFLGRTALEINALQLLFKHIL